MKYYILFFEIDDSWYYIFLENKLEISIICFYFVGSNLKYYVFVYKFGYIY